MQTRVSLAEKSSKTSPDGGNEMSLGGKGNRTRSKQIVLSTWGRRETFRSDKVEEEAAFRCSDGNVIGPGNEHNAELRRTLIILLFAFLSYVD